LGKKLVRPFSVGETSNPGREDFWALKDVSFEVKRGGRVGVIGRNGAGKSTLLKILSRITEPSTGRVSIKGRVSSLLEVGTGFHPELTGRENIFLNGAILGMSKAEIKKNFDAIVDFAGVEKFLDTPVKHYSSGMYVRLAFSVAAHLDTEILLVDEVLAVGDAEFQKKCMGKMDEVSHKDGRTILFVSHNMGAVQQLCNRVVCLNGGMILADSQDVSGGIKKYLGETGGSQGTSEWINLDNSFQNPWFQPLRFGLYGKNGQPISGPVDRNDEIWLEIEGQIEKTNPSLCVGYLLLTEEKTSICASFYSDLINTEMDLGLLDGHVCLRSKIPISYINNGPYSFELQSDVYMQEWITRPFVDAPQISMTLEGVFSRSPFWSKKRPEILAPLLPWELKKQ
jgi:lipopolysaccharide transport system ATP-binding protein